MKSMEEFRTFFETQLVSHIRPLEEERISIIKRFLFCTVGVVILGLILSFIFRNIHDLLILFGVLFLPVLLAYGFIIIKRYSSNFKDQVIDKIIEFFEPNLNYIKEGYISESEFEDSQLFNGYNRYSGDDLVEGEIIDEEYLAKTGKKRSTRIKFSELTVTHVSGTGKDRKVVTIFKGMFYISDFNKSFNSYTQILPNYKSNFFRRGEKVKLEDIEFEKYFEVYGQDQIESRYILSPSLMKRIVEFKLKTDKELHIAFKNNKIYVAITYYKDLFEPSIFKTLSDFENIKEYFEDLETVISIVRELNLNLRIWSKD